MRPLAGLQWQSGPAARRAASAHNRLARSPVRASRTRSAGCRKPPLLPQGGRTTRSASTNDASLKLPGRVLDRLRLRANRGQREVELDAELRSLAGRLTCESRRPSLASVLSSGPPTASLPCFACDERTADAPAARLSASRAPDWMARSRPCRRARPGGTAGRRRPPRSRGGTGSPSRIRGQRCSGTGSRPFSSTSARAAK
jgi:hypothetical protein